MSVALVAAGVVAVTVLHYSTGHGDPAAAHHLYRRLFYFPILAAAWLWGRQGGLVVSATVVAAYLPHAFGLLGAHADPASTIDKVADILLYVGIGGLVGWFVDRERGAATRLRELVTDREATIAERDAALDDLRAAQDSLVQSEHQAAMGFLTAGLAHEIRNPLGGIRGCAELLADGARDEARDRRLAELLVRETERLDGVLTRFLRFARRESGEAVPADVSALVDDVVELVASEAERSGVEVSHLRCAALPVVKLDQGAVRQVLLNLVVNALQVQAEGGTVRIVSGIHEAAGEMFVRVEDAGPGVPEDQRAAVFHPYHSTRPGGTGLGLAVSRQVMTEHGGTIHVGDASLGGAAFELRLPVGEGDTT